MAKSNEEIISKFSEVTGIHRRRYADPAATASLLGFRAAADAIKAARIDKEALDYIIVAHNFGDVGFNSNRVTMVPSLASKIKALLEIGNPDCVAYDLAFGCPGWIEGVIQANLYIKSGEAKRCLVVGTETLSRVIDPHDKDSMIFSDGAGAVVLEARAAEGGILAHKTQTYAVGHIDLLTMEGSNAACVNAKDDLYLKMNGRKVYEFAITHVPPAIQAALGKAGIPITEIKKIIIHQANEKMDHAIVQRLFKLYNIDAIPKDIMPMTIGELGNSSVATIPTLIDLIVKGKFEHQTIAPGDKVVLASVGAGMNINAIVYQF
ncbi:MAG TPA: ketoacyl-ACP synthase III [Chryseosolibacter sp.]